MVNSWQRNRYSCSRFCDFQQTEIVGAFHLVKNSENSRSGLNEKRFFRFARLENYQKKWNCSEGSPVFPVETFQWKFVFHLQISRLSHQSQAFRGVFRALLQLRWWFSLLKPEFTMNYTNAKKCFSRRIVGFPNDCRCGTLPVV